MRPLAHVYDVHVEVGLRDDFSVLLCDSQDLSHVLHAAYWLAYLTTNCDKWLPAIIQLVHFFIEIRDFILSFVFQIGRWDAH